MGEVKVYLPEKRRTLILAEVEVYTFGAHNSTNCHTSNLYGNMRACAANKCAGPGPSQCTGCQAGDAFVPWRTSVLSGLVSGSCHSYSSGLQYINFPGQGVPGADNLEQFFTKWGLETEENFGFWIPSEFEHTGETGIEVFPTCRQYKT